MINSIKQAFSESEQLSKRNILMFLLLSLSIVAFGQTKPKQGLATSETVKVDSLAVTVTVDSIEDIESTFKTEHLAEIVQMASENQSLSFKITCNKKTSSSSIKSSVSYKILGNSDDADGFLNDIEKVRAAAIKYYNNK